MAYILNIETATTNCSVSVAKDGKTIALKEDYDNGYSHAEKLHIYIDEVLKEAKIEKQQLDAIAVSKGPGSYTGLRIGVSAAKGLCFALEVPLISVSTLEALAHQVEAESGLIVPMLDARRLEVYSAIFNSDYQEVRAIEAQVLDENSFSEYLKDNKVYFIGNGVKKTMDLIKSEKAVFIEEKLPSANEMSALSFEAYKKSNIQDVAYFEPFYLKDFIALKSKK